VSHVQSASQALVTLHVQEVVQAGSQLQLASHSLVVSHVHVVSDLLGVLFEPLHAPTNTATPIAIRFNILGSLGFALPTNGPD
jgi:hypothetical protein